MDAVSPPAHVALARPLWRDRALVLAGIVLAAFNLRTAVTSLTPLLDSLGQTLGFGSTTGNPATVEIVGSGVAPKKERDLGLLIWTGVGITLGLVLAAIVLWILTLAAMRLFGTGDANERPRALSRDEATRVRVNLGPDGLGATPLPA